MSSSRGTLSYIISSVIKFHLQKRMTETAFGFYSILKPLSDFVEVVCQSPSMKTEMLQCYHPLFEMKLRVGKVKIVASKRNYIQLEKIVWWQKEKSQFLKFEKTESEKGVSWLSILSMCKEEDKSGHLPYFYHM